MSNPPPTASPMPPALPFPPLTLIVATTPSLGIGLRGTLPWPPIKSDLAFFARVTKRAPPPSRTSSASRTPSTSRGSKNAVIMGRKTWESIPPKFRPLKGRINVVISRAPEKLGLDGMEKEKEGREEAVMAVGSIEEGLRRLQHTSEGQEQGPLSLGRVFVIGGAEIYAHALTLSCCERILWTRLKREFECDAFFPAGTLPGGGEVEGGEESGGGKWVTRTAEELREWTGEGDGLGGMKKEGEVEFEVVMVEREGAAAE